METNDKDKALEAAKQLIEAVKKQFEVENEKIKEYRKEIYRERDFKVSRLYTYNGPNFYLDCQSVVFNLFIAPNGDSVDFFKEEVVKVFPTLKEVDTPYVVDLFVEVLMLVLKMDIDLFINKYSIKRDEDEYTIAVEYLDKKCTYDAIYLVSDWFKALANDKVLNFNEEFVKLQAKFDKSLLGGPTLYSLVEAGLKRDIPVTFLIEENQFQWGYGVKQLRGRSTTFHTDGIKDTEFTMYKDMVGDFLMMCGFPTPTGKNCFEEEEIVAEAKKLGFPVVVKPVAGHKGQGVTTGIESEEEVRKAFRKITKAAQEEGVNFDGALVQQQVYGTDHRLLAVGGKFVAALERVPAYVDGDGVNTIESLIIEENAKLIRLDNARSPLCKIKMDDNLVEFLKLQNLSLNSIPNKGERITLRRVANISAGGVSINVSDKIHPENVKLVEDIAGFFNVKCLGIDVLSADISKPWKEGNFGIIEINAGPGVFMHLAPAYGGSIDVPEFIMKSHFDLEKKGRIPIIAGNKFTDSFITNINNKLKEISKNVFLGSVTESGVGFNAQIFHKNPDHDQNIKIVLRNPKVNFAVFTHEHEDILDFGIWHQGADIVVLDEASYVEEVTLKDQLLPNCTLLDAYEGEIRIFRNNSLVESIKFDSDSDKENKIFNLISEELACLIEKY